MRPLPYGLPGLSGTLDDYVCLVHGDHYVIGALRVAAWPPSTARFNETK
jgi:hypothetical protein